MDILNNDVLTMLIKERGDKCLSIYTPTHRTWNELDQDMLRFKNQVKEAERILSDKKVNGELSDFLQPAYKLADDREFWNYQNEGLAVFVGKNEFYNVKIPFQVREKIYLSNRFYIKHLLPVFNGDRHFFILSLDLHNIRLFRGYHYNIKEINLEDTPVNIEDALGLHGDTEKKMQFRNEISTGNTQNASFHGQGAGNDSTMRKRDILRFFEMVNNGVINILKHEKSPLILAGVEHAIPLYREANQYQNIYEGYLKLDVDYTRPEELFDKANTLLDPYYDHNVNKDLKRYGNLTGINKASDNPAEILKAGYESRISVLFINPEVEIWGQFDLNNYSTIIHKDKQKGDDDLVELAATQTLLHNGSIYTLPKQRMPDNRAIAAIYRF